MFDIKGFASLSSAICSAYTNISYNVRNCNTVVLPLLGRKNVIIEKSMEASLLGQSYSHEDQLSFESRFRDIVWYTYRRDGSVEDVGWGCTIRVAQMMLTEAMRRCFNQTEIASLISRFEGAELLSLPSICKAGNFGERWTGCGEVLVALQSLLSKHRAVLNYPVPMELVYSQWMLGPMEQEYSKSYPRHIVIYFLWKNPKQVFYLMKNPCFAGMIGGVRSQALFGVGSIDDEDIIILDPHYVQSENLVYTSNTPKRQPLANFKEAVAFSFFLQEPNDLFSLASHLLNWQHYFPNEAGARVKSVRESDWIVPRKASGQCFITD